MRKSSPTTAKRGNVAKADSYREALSRVKAATENGFFIEATAIIESMMCDRLLSYLHGAHGFPLRTKKGWHHGFGDLVKEARRHVEVPGVKQGSLWEEIDVWRDKRNGIVHALVRSDPGTPPVDVSDFLSNAERACSDGRDLFRRLDAWHRSNLRKDRKPVSSSG